jgi:hypothetical protein
MTFPAQYGASPLGVAPAYAGTSSGGEKILILSPLASDLATIAASSEIATLPAANLLTMQPQKKWRALATSATLTLTCPTPIAANALALVAHNLSSVATIRVRGASTLAGLAAAPAVDTGAQWAWPASGKPLAPSWPNFLSLIRWAAVGAFSYWQIDIADSDPSQTYLEAGRLVLAEAWQPTAGGTWDIGAKPLIFDALDVQARTANGYTFTDRRAASAGRRMVLTISTGNARETQDGLAEILRLRGMWGDVIVSADPGATVDFHRMSMQALMTAAPEFGTVPYFDADGGKLATTLNLSEIL